MTLLPEPREIRRIPRNGPLAPPSVNHDFPSWQPAAEEAPAARPFTVEILTPTGEWAVIPNVTPALVLSAEELPNVTHQMNGFRDAIKRSTYALTFTLPEFTLADFPEFLQLLSPRVRRRLRKKLKLIAHYREKLERVPSWKRTYERRRSGEISHMIVDETHEWKLRQQHRARGRGISFVIFDEAQNLQ